MKTPFVLSRFGNPDIVEKVVEEIRLTREEGLRLFESEDLTGLAALASIVRERKNGRKSYYVMNRHINYSNVCIDTCLFCAFARRPMQKDGQWTLQLDEIFEKAELLRGTGVTEIHSVGGLHPDLPFDYYTNMLRGLKERCPDLHLKAFTAVEIDWFAQKFGMTFEEVLQELIDAGLDSMPGGGAEVFSERVRRKICRTKTTTDGWFEVHDIAHRLGLKTNCTMLFGHIETHEERVDHILMLREQQDKSGGFMAFVPLSFHPENTFMPHIPKVTAREELKTLAISRLLFDNIDHVKAYWIMTGVKLAQIAMSYGVDDLDGTVIEEKITTMAGGTSPQHLQASTIRFLIREAGYVPCRRSSVYDEIPVQEEQVALAAENSRVYSICGKEALPTM